MGEPQWATDDRFASADGRVEHQREIEAAISEWTATREGAEIVEAARQQGLACGVVQDTEDMLRRDPQLAARGFFEEIPHFKRGTVTASGIPLGLTGTPGRTAFSGSSIGHDNEVLLREVLGLGSDEIERLIAIGAVETRR